MIIKVDGNNISDYKRGIASVHYSAYSKNHFTSCFSEEKLEKYYQYLVESSDLSFVLDLGDGVEGFVISGRSVGVGVQKFIQDESKYLWTVFLKHPYFLYEKVISKLKTKFSSPDTGGISVPFRLMSIAVNPNNQSKGVGAELIEYLEASLPNSEGGLYGLSVRKSNKRAVEFYFRHGFKVQKVTRDSQYLYKELNDE